MILQSKEKSYTHMLAVTPSPIAYHLWTAGMYGLPTLFWICFWIFLSHFHATMLCNHQVRCLSKYTLRQNEVCFFLSVTHEEFGQGPEMGLGHRAELWGRTINSCREYLSSNDIHKVPDLTKMASCLYVLYFHQSSPDVGLPGRGVTVGIWFPVAKKPTKGPTETSLATWTPRS